MSNEIIGKNENIFGSSVRMARKSLGLTQGDFSKPLSISGSYVSDIEKGKAIPSEAVVREIASHYRISRDFMFTGSGPMFTNTLTATVPAIGGDMSSHTPDTEQQRVDQLISTGRRPAVTQRPINQEQRHGPDLTPEEEGHILDQTLYVIRAKHENKGALISNVRAFYNGVKREEEMVGVKEEMREMKDLLMRMSEQLNSMQGQPYEKKSEAA